MDKLSNKNNLLSHVKLKCCQKVKVNLKTFEEQRVLQREHWENKNCMSSINKKGQNIYPEVFCPCWNSLNFILALTVWKSSAWRNFLKFGINVACGGKVRLEGAQELSRCWQESKTTQGHPKSMGSWGHSREKGLYDVGQCDNYYLLPRINLPLKADALK